MIHQDHTVCLTFTGGKQPQETTIRWESPIIGVRYSRFVSPYQGDDLALVIRALDAVQSRRNPHAVFSTEEQARLDALGLWHGKGWLLEGSARRVGQALYRALCADPQGAQALGTVRDYAASQDRPFALCLRLSPTQVELAALPWEVLWDDGPSPLLLSRGRLAACTRHLDLAQALPPPREWKRPLHVLVLTPHANVSPQVRAEGYRAIRTAWEPLLSSGQVALNELSPVTRESLVNTLQTSPPPDVIHYQGHGHYEGGEGALLLDDASGKGCWTSTSKLAALFSGVRMVVLFACQGAMVAPPSGLLTGVAPALSAAGIPIVLGMQVTVRIRAAARASGVMYRALAAGWSVQQAVSLVRQALYVDEEDQVSWYVPVLYVRTHDTAPVHLVAPVQPEPTDTLPRMVGAHQTVVAQGNSHIRGVAMRGSAGTHQDVRALENSTIAQTNVQAVLAE